MQLLSTSIHIWLKAAGFVLFLSLFSVAIPSLLWAQDTGKKVKPSSRGTINITEVEKQEKEHPHAERKKLENDDLKLPQNLPIPKGAKGKSFKVQAAGKRKRISARRSKRKVCCSLRFQPKQYAFA